MARILDIGCGRKKYPDSIGIDMSPAGQADVLCDWTKTLPFADSSFDQVRMIHIIEEVDDIFRMLGEAHRVAKPGTLRYGRQGPDSGRRSERIAGRTRSSGQEPFDLIFIDAGKAGYVEYFGFAWKLSRPGTVIRADNVIRHGKVMAPDTPDLADRGARAYNSAMAADFASGVVIVPIVRRRIDGLAISIVK